MVRRILDVYLVQKSKEMLNNILRQPHRKSGDRAGDLQGGRQQHGLPLPLQRTIPQVLDLPRRAETRGVLVPPPGPEGMGTMGLRRRQFLEAHCCTGTLRGTTPGETPHPTEAPTRTPHDPPVVSDNQGNVYSILEESAKKPITAIVMELLLHTHLCQVAWRRIT